MDDETYDRLALLWLDEDPPQGLFQVALVDRHKK
jgi:hypothetical protein